jgi:hypothetical protein
MLGDSVGTWYQVLSLFFLIVSATERFRSALRRLDQSGLGQSGLGQSWLGALGPCISPANITSGINMRCRRLGA